MRVEAQRGQIGGEKGGGGGIGRAGEGTGTWGGASGRRLCAVRPGVPTGVPQRLVQGSAPQTCACPGGGPERSEGGRRRDATAGQAVSPRAATLDTPPRLPRVPAADSPATHRHSSSTLSSCRLLDCTPWAPAAASRLRLLLRLLPPAAARRPDKRAEGDSGRGGPRSKGSPERDGSGCQEGRRAQSEVGSGADARHSAGVGLWVVGLRGGRDHCGCPEGGQSYGQKEGPGQCGRHRPGKQQCSG